jgi:hypothetical protein
MKKEATKMRKEDKKMRKVMTVILTVLGFLAFTSLGYAASISNTKHNLSSAGLQAIKGDVAEICVYCHTPHGGKMAIADDTGPLWNRNATAGPFTPYASYTLDSSTTGAPTSVSKACLSCHDGTVGVNQMINRPGSGSGSNPADNANQKVGGPNATNNMALLGTDLRDDHPVSMIYASAKSYGTGGTLGEDSYGAGFKAAELSGTKPVVLSGSVTLPLYGTALANAKVECGSCHDPHEARSFASGSSVAFLRTMNTGSALCLTCHLK